MDAGTTVHGHGKVVSFLNATEIETELRESVFGACDAFIPMLFAETPPGSAMAASIALPIFVIAACVLFAAFLVFRHSKEDRNTIKALRSQRDLGFNGPLYDASVMVTTHPDFPAPSDDGYLNVNMTVNPMYSGYSSSGSSVTSSDDDTQEPSSDHRRSDPFKQSKGGKGAKHGAKTMKRLAREEWVASMPADVTPQAPVNALVMMFNTKQTNQESNYWGVPASGSLAAGAGLSRKERRASKKAAKKAQKAGSSCSGAFNSPLSNADNDPPASEFDTDDSRNASDDEYGIFAQDGFEDGEKIWMEWG